MKSEGLPRVLRKDFSKLYKVMEVPSLIDLQRLSFEDFLQIDYLPESRNETIGLEKVFREVFPIKDYTEKISLEFVSYELGQWECKCGAMKGIHSRYEWECKSCKASGISELKKFKCPECKKPLFYKKCPDCNSRVTLKPKYTVPESLSKGKTFAIPLKVKIQLIMYDIDPEDAAKKTIRDIKEQEVYLGEFPLMSDIRENDKGKIRLGDKGTFIINGTERVIVSQMHRSPGAFFTHDEGKVHASGMVLFSCRIIPYRGSWLDFEFDYKDILHVKIDKKRKLPATVFLKALGYSSEEILKEFYQFDTYKIDHENKTFLKKVQKSIIGSKASVEIKAPGKKAIVAKENKKISKRIYQELKDLGIKEFQVKREGLYNQHLAKDIINRETGEVIAECNQEITEEVLEKFIEAKIKSFETITGLESYNDIAMSKTLGVDLLHTPQEAQEEIYKRLRPGDPPTEETAKNFFESLFFDAKRYDLSKVGRMKLNNKLDLDVPIETSTLTKEDVLAVVRHLLELKNGIGSIDDIDHLGNRRVRTVGELLENQFRMGLVRLERAIRERMRMNLQDAETLMPTDLINSKPVTSVIKEFFGSSQLSQFMDQTNPLSELTHKRRLSALGPGGLTRERAGFDVRDVQPSHYGRICPVETPEGPNIGLIASLSTYARVNEFGFIETPYRKVVKGKVTSTVEYLPADIEDKYVIAQANAPIKENGEFESDRIRSRKEGDFILASPEQIDYMDVSPKQLVSVASSMIPFLEHDDANRALMGSNMQRQSVPLVKPGAPIVGTGMEAIVAKECGAVVVARHSGIVESVSGSRIVIRISEENGERLSLDSNVDIYTLRKFERSNQNTTINQKPIVKKGQYVKKGDVVADGPSTDRGDLALGNNVLVAFMPWQGYNFEDSILISEKVVKDDLFTSIHIERFELEARDTKFGAEEVTRDIPNIGEGALNNLDESGIVYIGAKVKAGDILVGKITPKGESQLSPEEKLLRAIFGEKARDVKDTSLKMPPGASGIVTDVKVFSRRGVDKDERSKLIEDEEINKIEKDFEDEKRIIKEDNNRKIFKLLIDCVVKEKVTSTGSRGVIFEKGDKVTPGNLRKISPENYSSIKIKESDVRKKIEAIEEDAKDQIEILKTIRDKRISRLQRGDELPPGVIKLVRVYVAIERKLSVGDKMAGRHGNKGVVSRIVPEEDMPYLPDGTPVDIVLNPLGVPSRMNLGQILETHLGWAAKKLGEQIQKIVDEASIKQIKKNIDDCKGWELAEDLMIGTTDMVLQKKDEVLTEDTIMQAKSLGLDEAFVKDYPVIREQIKSLFNNRDISKYIDSLTSKELKDYVFELEGGIPMSTPVFDGAHIEDIERLLGEAGLPVSGKHRLYDGKTGESFAQEVTVGYIYMNKLHHLVDDKLHARSIGPYSLVTQQPLGGKSQFGGQRLGEMEVWALEAYGAANILQEMLTVKSDDISGRTSMYEAIVRGVNPPAPGLPESFNVLVKELQSLGLDVELIQND